jgi:cytochrome-b5 reductase
VLGNDFTTLKLLDRVEVSGTSSVLRFGLTDDSQPLKLSTCACILAKADLPNRDSGESEAVVRPYTPISTNALVGAFDLLVKNYEDQGRMSTHLCSMPVGDTIDFKHIPFNVKIQAPFPHKRIGMIVGGTGITPMIQALHAVLGDEAAPTEKVSMVYGSRHSKDILGKEMLDAWEGDKLEVTHVLSNEPTDSEWKGLRGFITANLLKEKLPAPDGKEDVIIFVCGPPIMYDIFCGPRSDPEVTGVLAELGYTKEQVFKF